MSMKFVSKTCVALQVKLSHPPVAEFFPAAGKRIQYVRMDCARGIKSTPITLIRKSFSTRIPRSVSPRKSEVVPSED